MEGLFSLCVLSNKSNERLLYNSKCALKALVTSGEFCESPRKLRGLRDSQRQSSQDPKMRRSLQAPQIIPGRAGTSTYCAAHPSGVSPGVPDGLCCSGSPF